MNDLSEKQEPQINKPDLLRTMHGRDYSADTIFPILEEIFRQTEQGKEDPLANKVRDAIWDCRTEEEALEAAMRVLKVSRGKQGKENV